MDVTMSKAQAKAAMTMHQRQGISLKEAWRRVKGGGRGGVTVTKRSGKRGGRSVTVRVGQPNTVLGKVKRGLVSVGGAKGAYLLVKTANTVNLGTRIQNIKNNPNMDQVIGQAKDAMKDLEARGGDIVVEGLILVGGKWVLNKLGVGLPDWV
jgi:hypothetical protein